MTVVTDPNIHTQKINEKVYGNTGNQNVLAQVPATASAALDIGCGRGDNARELKNRGIVTDGISISEKEIEMAGEWLRAGVLYNVEQGLPDSIKQNKYDVIICSHIIEHVQYPEKLLADIRQVMKPESVFIVALPNIMHYKSRWQLLKGNFNYQDTGIWDNTHVKWYTFNSAKKLMSDNGFVVVKADVTGELPWLSLFRHILRQGIRKRIFSVLKGISRGFFGYELLYVSKINLAS